MRSRLHGREAVGDPPTRANLDANAGLTQAPKKKALTSKALGKIVVERRRIELPTFALRTRRSPS
jgi:hypothetical protein